MKLLLISNVYKTFYFCGSLIQSSQCCQITTIVIAKLNLKVLWIQLYNFILLKPVTPLPVNMRCTRIAVDCQYAVVCRNVDVVGLYHNFVARARDPLWEESWGSGKKSKKMHGIHCIPLLPDPVHQAPGNI